MKFKPGVDVTGLHPMMDFVLHALLSVEAEYAYESTVTSGRDSQHSAKSKHYAGQALDVRTRDLPGNLGPAQFASELRKRLPAGFDVVVESDHIHVEYDPRFKDVNP